MCLKHANRQPIRLGDAEKIVARNQRTGPRHILHEHVGIAGNVLSHRTGEEPPPEIIKPAWRRTNNDSSRFTAVEVRLSVDVALHVNDENEKNNTTNSPYDF